MAPLEIGGLAIPWTPTLRPEDTTNMAPYNKQENRTDILPKGWKKSDGKRALPCDLVWEQNVEVPLRDGVKIFCDVLRPVTDEKVPAIIAFSPYGKAGHGFQIYDNCPFRLGIREDATSGLEKFESIDPAEWAPRGYAVVNVDIRGSWESGGDLYIEATQMGVDAADVIEWIAKRDWCLGTVSMAGNSWLATTQWIAAIQQPPSLKCIAPWEGFTDMYRDVACRGGIPKEDFLGFIFNQTIRGRNRREDVAKAARDWPLMNAYWQDKVHDASAIKIPVYALASYSSAIHPAGTIRAFNAAGSKDKWLRVHPTQEWFDLYTKESTDELQKFFDRYLKNIDNGWEKTPKVRVSVLTYGDRYAAQPIVNIPFTEYPPQQTVYQKLLLSANKTLVTPATGAITDGTVSYQADDLRASPADFVHVFAETTTLLGYSKAKLWVSCNEADDMDIYLSMRKQDVNGKLLEHINIPWEALPEGINTQEDVPNSNTIKHLGMPGVLRASHRETDPERSTDIIPFHPHTREDRIPPGTIVPIEIGIWPMGVRFEKGEALVLRVQGFLDQCVEFPKLINGAPKNRNKGKHIIHICAKHDSHLIVPTVSV
ncbi:related to cocaine esterase [Cephalotrichum gorgonifer]|uniref:Related to cocaine esterase n=1 Tax=Cephalotrichum gorgonifer TaxID=2041049 RepID=A0AAE8N1G8_9PEZI|nr:related to cocaine esterase [Cephalotrichum gorgonifer]